MSKIHLNINKQPISINYFDGGSIKNSPIIFLHGFTGNLEDWFFLKEKLPKNFSAIFIDLLGHGKSSSPDQFELYSAESQMEILDNLFDQLNISEFTLVGYSMGGRLALSYTLKFPKKVNRLVLESTSFGITEKKDREERIKSDFDLAAFIENSTLDDFIDFWMEIPILKSYKRVMSEQKFG